MRPIHKGLKPSPLISELVQNTKLFLHTFNEVVNLMETLSYEVLTQRKQNICCKGMLHLVPTTDTDLFLEMFKFWSQCRQIQHHH